MASIYLSHEYSAGHWACLPPPLSIGVAVKLAYHANIDEIIDVNLRAFNRLSAPNKWKQNTAARLGLVTGIVAFFLIPGGIWSRVGIALFFIAFVVGCYLYAYPITIYKRTRDLVLSRHRDTNGADVEIELRESGVWTRTGGTEIEFSWSNVSEIIEEPTVIEMRMKDGGLLVAQKRAFESKDEIAKFIGLAMEEMKRPETAGQPAAHP